MEIPLNFFILASTLLLVFGGTLAASIAVANAAERTPRRTGLFRRFIAAMIESRQLQAQRVIDRHRAIGHRNSPSSRQSRLRFESGRLPSIAIARNRPARRAQKSHGHLALPEDRKLPPRPIIADCLGAESVESGEISAFRPILQVDS